MPHSICAVTRRATVTRRVPHEEPLILHVAHHAVLLRQLPIPSLAPERHIGIDRRGAAGGQVAGEKRGAD
jgi:hypothetical protein